MPTLHQYDYIMAIGTMFAALDAFMIGANDVANSFATSVSSRSLTLRQACCAAALMEFLGGVLVGARVTSTIKNGIVPISIFEDNGGVQILTFCCALVASATWLTIATRCSWPVSTTYSIVSAIAGAGVAVAGWDAPNWGWNNGQGIATIFAGIVIAPGISAGFAAVVYLIVKYGILVRRNPTHWGLFTAPIFFFAVAAILTMSIIFKGAPSLSLDELPPNHMAAAIVGTGAVIAVFSILFWLPYVHAKVVKKDYTIRWYHFFYGPLLWKRPAPADADHLAAAVPDYRVRDRDEPEVLKKENTDSDAEKLADSSDSHEGSHVERPSKLAEEVEGTSPKKNEPQIEGAWAEPKNLYIIARYKAFPFIKKVLTHGTTVNVLDLQAQKGSKDEQRLHEIHERAKQFPNDTEHLYSFLQVLTACTASFGHGANDLSNAIGPFVVIYQVWSTGESAASRSPVPVWALVFGAICLVIGLATYGYNIMRVLGNRITLHSPSRGFSMELGASITVILASQYGLPVSTTMCITGATIGVAICNWDWRAVNWRAIAWIYIGWILTVPIVGIFSGCLTGIILNAPHF